MAHGLYSRMAGSITLNNGKQIPWIGFGTGTALFMKDANEAATLALKTGFTHLDGAQMYRNEDSLGKAIAKYPRESLFVTTKLHTLSPGETVRDSLLASLKRFGLDYVDLWLIHEPTPHAGKLKQIWHEFEEVYREGLAKNIGVSNFGVENLKEIIDGATVVPQVNQIRFHPGLYASLKPLLEYQKQYDIKIQSFGGLTPIRKSTGDPLNTVLTSLSESVSKRSGVPVNEGQVLLKWLQAKDIVIITTSYKESRLKEYLNSIHIPALTEEEVRAIDEAGSSA